MSGPKLYGRRRLRVRLIVGDDTAEIGTIATKTAGGAVLRVAALLISAAWLMVLFLIRDWVRNLVRGLTTSRTWRQR